MGPGEFVAAYRRDAVERADTLPAGVEELLSEPREWSHRWGVLLHDALALRQAPHPNLFNRMSVDYVGWLREKMAPMWLRLFDWYLRTEDEASYARALMELQFHHLNGAAQHAWVTLIYQPPNSGMAPTAVDQSCYFLAVKALGFDKIREELRGEDAFFDPQAQPIRAWHTGALTEIDAYIALLDMTRKRGNVVVVPAPAQFERLAGSANVDFIVCDKGRGLLRGIQVKAAVPNSQKQRYDRRRVTMIDGSRDLGNTRAVRTDPLHSDLRTVSWPGLIAAHFLVELAGSRATDKWVPRKELIQRQLAARHYVGSIVSQNGVAYQNVGDRVRYDLAAAPSGSPGSDRRQRPRRRPS